MSKTPPSFARFTGLILLSLFFPSFVKSQDAANEKHAKMFLRNHCVRCHGEQTQEASLRLDTLSMEFSSRRDIELWTEVMDRINQGEMPPREETRPDVDQTDRFITWLADQIHLAEETAKNARGNITLRRLNRRQYNNAIRDLFGIDDFHPADEFPEDPPAYGFDHIGSALSVSPLHIEKYVAAARQIVDRVIHNRSKPISRKWRFELDQAVGKSFWLTANDSRGKPRNYARVFAGENSRQGEFVELHHTRFNRYTGVRDFKVHMTGPFIIRIRAAGHIPDTADIVRNSMQLQEQIHQKRLARAKDFLSKRKVTKRWKESGRKQLEDHYRNHPIYAYGPPRMRVVLNDTEALPVLDVANDIAEPQVYEYRVHLDRHELKIKISNDYEVPETAENFWHLKDEKFPRPLLFVDWLEVEGPLYAKWPPESHRIVVGSSNPRTNELSRAKIVLKKLMWRAFRRPVRTSELAQMLELFRDARKSNDSFEEAIKIPLIAILSSPHFLYLVENDSKDGKIDSYELSNRLSFFLWNSIPDHQLQRLATTGELLDKSVLTSEVDRMLQDVRSESFVHSFVHHWLGTKDLGAVNPDKRLYPRFDEHLLESMKSETEVFFSEILHTDLSVLTFLKSDFTMANERLARFYGIKDVRGDHFRRVALKPEHHRSGVLSHASVHTVTSNGTRTSPVKRGVWILENLLGSPPPPPPPDAGDIEPTVPGIGKATVRDRLEAHRSNPACASCHRKIDPLGFGLENYNAIGQWRAQEAFGFLGKANRKDPLIDSRGKLPDGTSFQGIEDLQQVLLDERDQFVRCLTEKMIVYALGRGLTFQDREHIDQIVNNMSNHGHTLRGMIKDIVVNPLFLER